MLLLRLERFHCIEDTDAAGFQSPCFVTCVADFRAGMVSLQAAPRATWPSRECKGEAWLVQQVIGRGLSLRPAQTLVLAAMLEREGQPRLPQAQGMLLKALQSLRHAGWQATDASVQRAMLGVLQSGLTVDGLAPPVRHVPTRGEAGLLPPASFPGDSGLYKVWYREVEAEEDPAPPSPPSPTSLPSSISS